MTMLGDTEKQHDLSALDGLLGDLDIAEAPTEDPKRAKLQALFDKAKATYTAKVDSPRWFVQDIDEVVPSPQELQRARKEGKSRSTHQEWTVNYLYTQGNYETCLSYVVSYAQSMKLQFAFAENVSSESEKQALGGSKLYQSRSKEERDLSKNWSVIKDIVDAGMRSVSALIRTKATTSQASARHHASTITIKTWIPHGQAYVWSDTSLLTIAKGFMAFAGREIRLGTGDPRFGYSGMVVSDEHTGKLSLDMAKINLQNWTVSYGFALTLGNLALELGYYRVAIEAHALFLANRGLMWRVLLSLAHALYCYSEQLVRSAERTREAMLYIAKAAAVSAIQSSPKSTRTQVANVVLSGTVLPSNMLLEGLDTSAHMSVFTEEDQLLFSGLLCRADNTDLSEPPLAEEIAVCLVKVVFAKKGGVMKVHDKFSTYISEYHRRRAQQTLNDTDGTFEFGDEDEATESGENGPRSVRTL